MDNKKDDEKDYKAYDLNYIFDGPKNRIQNPPPESRPQSGDIGFNQNQLNYGSAPQRYAPASAAPTNFVKIFVSIFVALILFISGFLIAYFAVPSEEEKLVRWIKQTSDAHFYNLGDDINFTDGIGDSMVGSMDRFSSFYNPQNLETLYAEMEGISEDTGMILAQFPYESVNRVIVLKVYQNSPAAKYVRVGDMLTHFNNEDVSNKNISQISETVSEYYRNNSGEASYTFKREGEALPIYATIGREKYEAVYVQEYDSASGEMQGVDLPDDVYYISFEEFSTNADTQFAQAMASFKEKGKTKLILDLRTNFGGSMDILQSVASHLITDSSGSEKTLITKAKFKNGDTVSYNTLDNFYNDYNFEKIVVIANENSASATEVLICAMKDYGTIDTLVGVNTFGKAVMQQFFQYKNYGMYMTVAQLYAPVRQEYSYNEVGFAPDVKVGYNISGSFSTDNQLLAAVAAIS